MAGYTGMRWLGDLLADINLRALATHEFGHSLGLGHSSGAAVMAYSQNLHPADISLPRDDIERMRENYPIG